MPSSACKKKQQLERELRKMPLGGYHLHFSRDKKDTIAGTNFDVHVTYEEHAEAHSFFFLNDAPTPEIYTLSLHDALPISRRSGSSRAVSSIRSWPNRSSPASTSS